MYHAADKLLHGPRVLDSQKLADLDRQGQLDERAVRIHNERLRFFRGHVRPGSFSKHNDRELETDALAPA